jgi:hypothetical protein
LPSGPTHCKMLSKAEYLILACEKNYIVGNVAIQGVFAE